MRSIKERGEAQNLIAEAVPAIRSMLQEVYPNCTDEQIGLDEPWWPRMLELAKGKLKEGKGESSI